jgi:bifunctional UDP-N-acetylglucosamine pyrophosphorylase/glucosamine-1-phosphate N-acetyltransferase
MKSAAIVLAAGKGTRMTSDIPKVLHDIEGRPMVSYVIDTIRAVCSDGIYIVVGYLADDVIRALDGTGVEFVLQKEQLGTGHAVLQAGEALAGFEGTVLVLNGDVPCLRTETVRRFVDYHRSEGAAATVLSAELDDPTGYGRIVRGDGGDLLAIVEQKDADEATKRIREINSGLFCFDKELLFDALAATGRDNAQNEYYLTDTIELLRSMGKPVRAFCVDDSQEVAGVNTDAELEGIRSYIKGHAK